LRRTLFRLASALRCGGIMVPWNKEQDDEKKDLSGLLVMARSVFR
jgi:hypothetical protein